MNEGVDWNAMRFWLALAQWLSIIAVGIFAWWRTRESANTQAIADVRSTALAAVTRVESRVNEHSDRILMMEGRINALPTDDQLGLLHHRIDDLNRELGEVSATLTATNALLKLHQEFLMKGGGG